MSKVIGPAYSQSASGKLGNIVFDRRGYARTLPKKRTKPQTAAQGNVQQSFAAARKAVNIVSDEVETAMKRHKWLKRKIRRKKGLFQPGFWAVYLASEMRGLKRITFIQDRNQFAKLNTTQQTLWHKVATVVGLEWVKVPHASEEAIGPGLQLFWLSRTLYRLGLYRDLGVPDADNALIWAATITGRTMDEILTGLDEVTDLVTLRVDNKQNTILQETKPETKAVELTADKPKQTTVEIKEEKQAIFNPLANTLLAQLPTIAQNSFLPVGDRIYYSDEFGAGNNLAGQLPNFLLPAVGNNSQFDLDWIDIEENIVSSPPPPPPSPPSTGLDEPIATTEQVDFTVIVSSHNLEKKDYSAEKKLNLANRRSAVGGQRSVYFLVSKNEHRATQRLHRGHREKDLTNGWPVVFKQWLAFVLTLVWPVVLGQKRTVGDKQAMLKSNEGLFISNRGDGMDKGSEGVLVDDGW